MKNRNVSPFVKIRRLENRNEIGVFDALHLIVSHGTTRKQRQTYRYSSYSSSANRRDFRIESLLTIFFYAGRTHFMRSATENAKRAKMNVLNDLMIKPILTCITGMSNTDFIPATPRIVASVIVCSFAFYCYVCIYERTFSCFFLVKKSKLGLSSEFLLIDHLNSLVRKGLFTRLFFMRACARERERERESFVSFQSIIAFLLSRFVLLLFAGALSSFIGRGNDFVSLSRRFSFPHPSSAENLRESTFLF